MPRQPDSPPPAPVAQRLRLRYAKRARLRFSSHRDFQRALERALRRADVPVAFSAGFSPHPRISYTGAAPTGAASEAEYVEVAVTRPLDAEWLRQALDASLPPGLDVVEVVVARGGSLAERLTASIWRLRLPGVDAGTAAAAVAAYLTAERVEVTRLTRNGVRSFDTRPAVAGLEVLDETAAEHGLGATLAGAEAGMARCAILRLVVRHQQPAVRPDDVLSGLRVVADLAPPIAPEVTRLAQGPLDEAAGTVGDPLLPDRDGVGAER